jgi:hypothetical protein
LQSNIINMADRTADELDRLLESALRQEPIPDNGFSRRIVARIRRQIWVNRLALPVAIAIGSAVALKPVLQLVSALLPLANALPADLVVAPLQFLPQLQLLVLGGMVCAICVMLYGMVEET